MSLQASLYANSLKPVDFDEIVDHLDAGTFRFPTEGIYWEHPVITLVVYFYNKPHYLYLLLAEAMKDVQSINTLLTYSSKINEVIDNQFDLQFWRTLAETCSDEVVTFFFQQYIHDDYPQYIDVYALISHKVDYNYLLAMRLEATYEVIGRATASSYVDVWTQIITDFPYKGMCDLKDLTTFLENPIKYLITMYGDGEYDDYNIKHELEVLLGDLY